MCLFSNKCVSCLAAPLFIQQYFTTNLFQQGLTRAQTAARTSSPCLLQCVRNFWSSRSVKPIKTVLPRMPIGKHLRISTECRMGLAVTVSQQLLITAQTRTRAVFPNWNVSRLKATNILTYTSLSSAYTAGQPNAQCENRDTKLHFSRRPLHLWQGQWASAEI